jgi:hypothetical protein
VSELHERARQGAERVLSECLPLSTGDEIALIFDDQTRDCAALLKEAAEIKGIVVHERYSPLASQQRFNSHATLPSEDTDAIDASRAIIICVSAGREGLAYRKALLEAAVDTSRYVAAVPGATLELLAYAVNVDYDEIQSRGEDLAVAMLAGDVVVLTSHRRDAAGLPMSPPLELRFRLGSFARSPITSTGIIPRGTWGNLPGGETFIAPLEGTADGQFVLNGAFTGRVMNKQDPLLLTFERGELKSIDGPADDRTLLEETLGWRDHNIRPELQLAELGIGLNPGIVELRGNALFDEKLAGTAHVAVGDNSIYGGTLKSSLHEDLITVGPSLTIDGKPILADGHYVLNASDWREDADHARRLGRTLPDKLLIRAQRGPGIRARADSVSPRYHPPLAGRTCVYGSTPRRLTGLPQRFARHPRPPWRRQAAGG